MSFSFGLIILVSFYAQIFFWEKIKRERDIWQI